MPYSTTRELPKEVKNKYTSKQLRAFRAAFNSALKDGKSEEQAFKIAHAAARRAGDRDAVQNAKAGKSDKAMEVARQFSTDQRKKLADKGHALPDGSFPIVTKQDLRNAIQAYGRASNKSKAKSHIIKRARALGATNMLPDDWTSKDTAMKSTKTLLTCQECNRTGFTEQALEDHAAAVHTHSDIHRALSDALRVKFPRGTYPRVYHWVRDVSDDWFIYEVETSLNGDYQTTLFKMKYSFADGKATLSGEPTEVRAQMTYVPVPKEG